MIRRRIIRFLAISLATVLLLLAGRTVYDLRPLAPLPEPVGRISHEAFADWARLVDRDTSCVLINNMWNKGAASSGFTQSVFLENASGRPVRGWRWRAPWQLIPTVISQPQLVCGDKPWDAPLQLNRNFPFQAGTKKLTADFDIHLRATGTYNMVLTLWAVSSLPATRRNITHEIMIWNVDGGQPRAGQPRGTLRVNGTDYEVYVEENHKDNSGSVTNVWTYVAFIAHKPVLKGPLAIDAFVDYLLAHKLLTRSHYLTSLEVGNEVDAGTGIVEIESFSLKLR